MRNRKRGAGGFTLVELIVVIAILAILAGVGTVAYSGYIKKANQAADDVLLSAVNTAFAAASTEAGNRCPSGGYATLDGDGKVASVVSAVDSDGSAFARYYAGNEDSAFKYYKSLAYRRSTGSFFGTTDWTVGKDADGNYTITSNGKTIAVSEEARDTFFESSFGEMGVNEVASRVSDLAHSASGVLAKYDQGNPVTNWPGMSDLASDLGLDVNNLDSDQLANLVVLYTARQLDTKVNVDELVADESEELLYGIVSIGQYLSSTTSETVAIEAAASYAMATAYANSDYGKNAVIKTPDGETMTAYEYYNQVNESLSGMSGLEACYAAASMLPAMTGYYADNNYEYDNDAYVANEWYDYYSSGAAAADLTAFMNTMGAINDNITNIDGQAYADEGMSGDYMSEILSLLFG